MTATPHLRDAVPKSKWIFIPGKLVNPLNGSHGHWSRSAKYREGWRRSVIDHAVLEHWRETFPLPASDKRITFRAHVWNLFDEGDGLPATCKPIRDALGPGKPGKRGAGIIHSDAPDSGHRFVYEQVVDRKHPGVEITIEELTT